MITQALPASVIALTHPTLLGDAHDQLSRTDVATAILTAAIFELVCSRRLQLEFRQRTTLWIFRRTVLMAVAVAPPASRPTIEEGLLQACALKARDGCAPVYDVVRAWFRCDRAFPEQHVIEVAWRSAAAEGWYERQAEPRRYRWLDRLFGPRRGYRICPSVAHQVAAAGELLRQEWIRYRDQGPAAVAALTRTVQGAIRSREASSD